MSRIVDALVALRLVKGTVGAARHPAPEEDPHDPSQYELPATRRTELALAALLVLTGALFAAFGVLVALDQSTLLLGGTLGGALAALAAALILAGLRVVPQETTVEERPDFGVDEDDVQERAEVERELLKGTEGVSRRGLIAAAAGTAGAGGAAAAILPLTALGPSPRDLNDTPWKAGLRVVDEDGAPLRADDLVVGTALTGFPEGADTRELGSPVVVARLRPDELRLPADRRSWAPQGIVAYSRICTHSGCAVSIFRYPTYEEQSSPPALQCPCHYSTFDPRRACKVVFGPAGRALPQLPLRIASSGELVAGGGLSGAVGPAWWGTSRGSVS